MSSHGISFSFYPFDSASSAPHEVQLRAKNGTMIVSATGVDDAAALRDLWRQLDEQGETAYASKIVELFKGVRDLA